MKERIDFVEKAEEASVEELAALGRDELIRRRSEGDARQRKLKDESKDRIEASRLEVLAAIQRRRDDARSERARLEVEHHEWLRVTGLKLRHLRNSRAATLKTLGEDTVSAARFGTEADELERMGRYASTSLNLLTESIGELERARESRFRAHAASLALSRDTEQRQIADLHALHGRRVQQERELVRKTADAWLAERWKLEAALLKLLDKGRRELNAESNAQCTMQNAESNAQCTMHNAQLNDDGQGEEG